MMYAVVVALFAFQCARKLGAGAAVAHAFSTVRRMVTEIWSSAPAIADRWGTRASDAACRVLQCYDKSASSIDVFMDNVRKRQPRALEAYYMATTMFALVSI